MDTITHTVLGACLGEVIAGRKLGKKAMLIGALANNLPDIDVVTSFWTSPAHELMVHRGITHSILFAVIVSPLFARAFQKRFSSYDVSFKRWLVLIGSGLFLHILLDAFTAYGTGWFEPFSNYRVTFNTLFILDPLLSIPMITGSVILLILNRDRYPKRSRVAYTSLYCSLCYLLLCILIKLYVTHVIENDLRSKNIPHQAFMATPTPLNNILWYSAVKSGDNFYTGYYSIFDKNPTVDWEFFLKCDSLLAPLKNSEEVKDLMHFSKNYYCVSKKNNTIIFSDMRFGQVGSWYIKQAPFVFNFELQMKKGYLFMQQGRFKSFNSKDLASLMERVKGIEN